MKVLRSWKGSECGKGYLDVVAGGWMHFLGEPVPYHEGDDSIENYFVQGYYHHLRKPSEISEAAPGSQTLRAMSTSSSGTETNSNLRTCRGVSCLSG